LLRPCANRTYIAVFCWLAILSAIPVCGQASHPVAPSPIKVESQLLPGVVVDEVEKNSVADKVGLRQGDILLTWSRADSHGNIESPFDLSYIRIEQQPRGTVTLSGLRNSEELHWVLGPDLLWISGHPNFSGTLKAAYLKSDDLARRGKIKRASALWEQATKSLASAYPVWLRCWALLYTARQFRDARQWPQAMAFYDRAAQAAAGMPLAILLILRDQTLLGRQIGDSAGAEKHALQAVQEAQKWDAESLEAVNSLRYLADEEWGLGKTDKAFELDTQAINLAKKIAPENYMLANCLELLMLIEEQRNNLAQADQYGIQALAIAEKLDPDSADFANILVNMGSLADRLGDFDRAQSYYSRAWAINATMGLNRGTAMSLSGLGLVASQRGDFINGEKYYRQALSIEQKINPSDIDVADTLTAMGAIAWNQGDQQTAERRFIAALKIRRKFSQTDSNVAVNKIWLGNIAVELGKLDVAEQHYQWIIHHQGGILGGKINIADAFDGLGNVEWKRGHLQAAEANFHKAVSLQEEIAPETPELADILVRLGGVLKDAGTLSEAEQCYRHALAIREKRSPGSSDHAESLAALAMIMRKRAQPEAAARFYEQALAALENQTTRLGGDNNVRADFRAKHATYYSEYTDLLLSMGKPDAAFSVFERSHSRTLIEMMAAANIDIHQGVDSALLDHERSLRKAISTKSDLRVRLMGEAHSEDTLKAVQKDIDELLSQFQDVESQIRVASPAYAELTQPQPLSAKEVQTQLLDPNTLLLEYSLGEDRSYVFAVTPDSLNTYELPKRADIEKSARHVYSLLTARNAPVKNETPAQKQIRLAKAEADYPRAAAALSKMILGPVAAQLQNKRLLIVTDGALAYIPFATLPEPANRNADTSALVANTAKAESLSANAMTGEPLILNHEIINLPSASVLAVLRQQEQGRKPAPNAVAVLADPVFDSSDSRVALADRTPAASAHSTSANPASANQHPATRSAKVPLHSLQLKDAFLDEPSSIGQLTRSATDIGLSRNGELQLPRLRFTRKEADAILAVTPEGAGKKAVDFDASRATATSPELSQYRIVHFATHGLLDSAHPELSGLVFSMVDKKGRPQNGFLELQDIYNLNLPADLVVLSACETGLGKEISGEGLVGLTRGLKYAGASRVVASLWRVSDVGTAELMAAFYTSMEKDGLPPAAALRAAQIKLLKQKRWSDPYYWAAFQIQGEWK
jgi:CHAT domain-containing protein/Tfp pilus assembly protein PilF